MRQTELEWSLPWARWFARVVVLDLDEHAAALARERWPLPLRREPIRSRIELQSTDEPVGLPLGPLVTADVRWRTADEALLNVRAGQVSIRWSGDVVTGSGAIQRARQFAALEAAFRAFAVIVLARRGVFVMHASAVRRGPDALLFLGGSGAGKTTTARRLGREGWTRIADDMVAADLTQRPPRVHGLPFDGRRRRLATPLVSGESMLRGALLIRKSAAVAGIVSVDDAPKHYAEALIAFAAAPGEAWARLEAFASLCAVPFGAFHVPPSGPLKAVVSRWLDECASSTGHRPTFTPPFGAMSAAPGGSNLRSGDVVVRRAPNVAWRVLDGVAVLVAPASSRVQTLNAVATRVWELSDGRELSAIVDAIVNEFEVSSNEARGDVERFVRDLEDRGLLVTGRQ